MCSFWRGFLRGWNQSRDKEGGSQVQIPSLLRALPCLPAAPRPWRAEWVGMAQNETDQIVSHLHPKIKRGKEKNPQTTPTRLPPGPGGPSFGVEGREQRSQRTCAGALDQALTPLPYNTPKSPCN